MILYHNSDAFFHRLAGNLIEDGVLPSGDTKLRKLSHLNLENLDQYRVKHIQANLCSWPLILDKIQIKSKKLNVLTVNISKRDALDACQIILSEATKKATIVLAHFTEAKEATSLRLNTLSTALEAKGYQSRTSGHNSLLFPKGNFTYIQLYYPSQYRDHFFLKERAEWCVRREQSSPCHRLLTTMDSGLRTLWHSSPQPTPALILLRKMMQN